MATSMPQSMPTQMEIDPQRRPRYSKQQLETYFERIRLPQRYLDSPVLLEPSLARGKEHGLPFVHALTRYHLANVPFENLELHYSAHRTISLNMDDLFVKFAEQGLRYGRGGRCMENNGFFATVLRSLGFEVRNCAGRVSRALAADPTIREKQSLTYDGWNHMLNLVRLDGRWYVVDVGMGAWGPNIPYPLEDGFETESIAPRRIRLQKRAIAEHAATDEAEAPQLWCYDTCNTPAAGSGSDENVWVPAYCFTEMEFLPQDYEVMSWFTSTSPKSFFTFSVLCTRMLLDDSGETIVGDITLFGDRIGKTVHGKREVLRTCRTEEERVLAIKEIFDVDLKPQEKAGISQAMRIQA